VLRPAEGPTGLLAVLCDVSMPDFAVRDHHSPNGNRTASLPFLIAAFAAVRTDLSRWLHGLLPRC